MKLKILFFVLLFLSFFSISGKNVLAQVNGNNVGPELADPPAGANVVCAKGYSGTAAVLNDINIAPKNTVPCAAHIILRVDVHAGDFGSSALTSFANQLNSSSAFNGGGPTIVLLGVEVNNLDQQGWNGARTLLSNGQPNNDGDTVTAASQYAQMFNQFSSAIADHSKYLIAPAPPDLYNSVYDPAPWVSVFANQVNCNLVDVLVADVFDVAPAASVASEGYSNLTTYQYLEHHVCSGKHVVHFEGWGAWPGETIQNQINFLKNKPLPAGVSSGTSLIVNNCGGFGGNTGGNSQSVKPWLYWIPTTPDKVYSADGSEFNYSTCTGGGGTAPKAFDLSAAIPCDTSSVPPLSDPEFHSLRPYPANPCFKHVQDTALLCSNSLVVIKTTTPNSTYQTSCSPPAADGSYTCTYANVPESAPVSIDLTGAQLPIMGNTEDVPNGTWTSPNTSANNLSASQRVNNYVSWYLNGVVNRAEEDFSSYDPNYLVNYSGPLNKLLPFAGQTKTRIDSIDVSNNTLNEHGNTVNNDKAARHDEIVGCPLTAKDSIIPCYLFTQANLSNLIPFLQSLIPGISIGDIQTGMAALKALNRLAAFSGHEPPQEKNYSDFSTFWHDYLGWIGNVCTPQVFGIKFYFCANLNTNFWAHLFDYVPYATTEDRVGTIGTNQINTSTAPGCNVAGAPCQSFKCADGTSIGGDFCPGRTTQNPGGTFNSCQQWAAEACNSHGGTNVNPVSTDVNRQSPSDVTFTPTGPTNNMHNLYFAHVQEDSQLSSQLQSTFKSSDSTANLHSDKNTPPEQGPGCTILDSRTNPGDKLYGNIDRTTNQGYDTNDEQIAGTVNFKGSYTCTFTPVISISGNTFQNGGVSGGLTYTCTSTSASLSVYSQTPEVQYSWDNLVGGNQSVFKRFYPALSPISPVTQIKEVPASTQVTYKAGGGDQVAAGNGSSGSGDSASAQVYIPYVGGIKDYFLDAIQTALRPQGMGSSEALASSNNGQVSSGPAGDCSYSGISIPDAMQKAADKYRIPVEMLMGISTTESADYRYDIAHHPPIPYKCSRNSASALGLMQVTDGTYSYITSAAEKIPNDEHMCSETTSRLSRCEPYDEMELSARVILSKIGQLDYSTFTTSAGFTLAATDISRIYRAACYYYGSCYADRATVNAAIAFIPSDRWRDGSPANMGYADIVCARMAMINPSLNYCSNPNNYPPRP